MTTEAETPAKPKRTRRKPATNEIAPWVNECNNLAADVVSHLAIGEISMAYDCAQQLVATIDGQANNPTIDLPYHVLCSWGGSRDVDEKSRVVVEEAKTRALACMKAAFSIKEAENLESVTKVKTRVVLPGTQAAA